MRVVVVGAGVAGLGTALALARHDHEVVLVERDATPMPEDAEAAFAWARRGAPQVRHSHALLARLRNLLRDEFPDVRRDLLAAGATEADFVAMLPETILDRSPRPGDADLVALACRRTTFEWVLRRAVLAAPHVELRDGVVAAGLLADGPVVRGVRIDGDDDVTGDVVVIAQGRRSSLPAWLAEIGVDLPQHEEDTGIVYFSRFYRLAAGQPPPSHAGPIAGDLGYCKYAVFDGDNRTFSITLACAVDDEPLRKRFMDDDGFTATARAIVATAPWVAPGLADPITEVTTMTSLVNRRRHFLTEEGEPRVLGLHAAGDAHTCTNPLYGRGCSLAMVQAVLLRDALAAHPLDAAARSRAYEQACDREVLPWYRAAVSQDRFTRQVAAEPDAPALVDDAPATGFSGQQLQELMREGLLPALRTDPDVFRAFLRGFNLLQAPGDLMRDPLVLARVLACYQDRADRPPEPAMGPADRNALLAT